MKTILVILSMSLATIQCNSLTNDPSVTAPVVRVANNTNNSPTETMFWKGVVNSREILWTSDDLTYESAGKSTSLFKSLKDRSIAERGGSLSRENGSCRDDNGQVCSQTFEYKLVSVFGNYATFEVGYHGVSKTMLSATELAYRTVDLSVPRESEFRDGNRVDVIKSEFYIRLDEIFDGREILAELLKRDDMRENLSVFEVAVTKLETAADLADLIKRTDYKMFLEDNRYLLSEDFLDSWAIRSYDNGKATVVIRLTDARNEDVYSEIPLELSVSASLKPALEKAASDEEGFLGDFAEQNFKNMSTKYIFGP